MKLLYRTVLAISITAAVIAVILMVMAQPPASSFEVEEDVWIVTSINGQPITSCGSTAGYQDADGTSTTQTRKSFEDITHPPTVECVQSAISPMILPLVGKD